VKMKLKNTVNTSVVEKDSNLNVQIKIIFIFVNLNT